MKTERCINEDGELRCFGFPNTLLGKQGTLDVLHRLPGIKIVFFDRSWGAEIFCEFTYKGEKFDICEPYGDNSYYDISCDSVNSSKLEEIYELFCSIRLPLKEQRNRYLKYLVWLMLGGIFIVYLRFNGFF